MGKPTDITPAKVAENYNWGEFGTANQYGTTLSPVATSSVQTTQSGINQYLNELINPSYSNESFRARQELLDASNNQYARQLGAEAMTRGARGSATQSILNSIAVNRNANMRQAMTEEDARVQNILSALSGIEGNYWQQSNAMSNNVLQRVLQNAGVENAAEVANTNAYNAWKNNLISTGAAAVATLIGSPLAGAAVKSLFDNNNIVDSNGNVIGKKGGYGIYNG